MRWEGLLCLYLYLYLSVSQSAIYNGLLCVSLYRAEVLLGMALDGMTNLSLSLSLAGYLWQPRPSSKSSRESRVFPAEWAFLLRLRSTPRIEMVGFLGGQRIDRCGSGNAEEGAGEPATRE